MAAPQCSEIIKMAFAHVQMPLFSSLKRLIEFSGYISTFLFKAKQLNSLNKSFEIQFILQPQLTQCFEAFL